MELQKINGYTIDSKIFELGFQQGCSPLCCKGKCCSDGVYLSLSDKQKIQDHTDIIKKYMDDTQILDERLWFENQIEPDADFGDGVCDSTQVHNNKCTFLNRDGHCVLQVAAENENMDKWAIKPFFCVAFPVVVSEKILTYDDMLEDVEPCCTAKNIYPEKFIDACKEEFLYILGEEGYRQLKGKAILHQDRVKE